MCGICGFFKVKNISDTSTTIAVMTDAIHHRGPDAQHIWIDDEVRIALGHARLSIIDIDGGSQPMHSSDRSLVIVFNGEIFNYRQIKVELESLGHIFASNSDTEVILAAYQLWGKDCLKRLNGMFAFAIFDRRAKKLFLARDQTGIKPLYFSSVNDGFFFASEIKSLLQVTEIPRYLNYQSLSDFLVLGYPLAPKTCFANISEMQPGSWLEISSEGITSGTYWNWLRDEKDWSEQEALEVTEKSLIESLTDHLVSDVPVGAFLSGGIDSSLIVALLAKSNVTLDTFNVRFEESGYDESPFARIVAKQFNTRHHEIVIGADSINLDLVLKVLDQFDQPFGDSSAIPSYLICKEIRKHVKVVLGGDGGDEMFGGYDRFRYADIAKLLGKTPKSSLNAILSLTRLFSKVSPERARQMSRMIHAAIHNGSDRLMSLSCYCYPDQLKNVLTPDISNAVGSYLPVFNLPKKLDQNAGGSAFIDMTIQHVLSGDYLRKVDMMSSAHGLEVRVPFLGRQVLECAANLPHRFRYSNESNKLMLRKLASKYLPSSVVNKPKAGFGIPLDVCLGNSGREKVREMLGPSDARVRRIVQTQWVDKLLNAFVTGKWDKSVWSRYMVYQNIYFLISLERWLERWDPIF